MKHLKILFVFFVVLQSCVQNDIIEDRVAEELSFNNSINELQITKTHTFETKFTDNVGQTQNVTINWNSSDSAIIEVTNSGTITAKSVGEATITATAKDSSGNDITNTSVTIKVTPLEETLTINNVIENIVLNNKHTYTTTFTDELGQTQTLPVTWSSSNTAVLSVSTTGEITAITTGDATITASVTTSNGKTVTAEDMVSVLGVQEMISINNPISELDLNGTTTHQYTTTYTDNNGQVQTPQVTWTTSDNSIATISADGLVTAVGVGNITITATTTGTNGQSISDDTSINIINTGTVEKTGTLSGSYSLKGTFTLKEIPNSDDLELSINDDYFLSSGVPGPYLYLSNSPLTVIGNGSKEISRVTTFSGAHKYIIPNTKINDFKYVFYWCKPFGVRIGNGEIN